MSIRRLVTLISIVIAVACRQQNNTQTATTTSPGKTATTAQEADLRKAKIKQTISTAIVEQTTDARLGTHANPQGVVIEESKEFKPGEPIVLSMSVKQSPSGLQMRAVWKDSKGKVIDEGRKEMNGAKIATFAYGGKKLAPGNYTVIGYWGGNIATEKTFKVAK